MVDSCSEKCLCYMKGSKKIVREEYEMLRVVLLLKQKRRALLNVGASSERED